MRTIIILFVLVTILTSAVTGGVVYYSQLNNVNNLTTQHQADLAKLNQQIQDLQTQLADLQANIDNQLVPVNDQEQQFQTSDAVSTDQIGYIKSIEKVNDTYYVNIDYVLLYRKGTEEALKAMVADDVCKSEDLCDIHPGTYIRNNNPLIRKFELLDTKNLNMVSELRSDKKYMVRCLETIPQGEKVTIEELMAYVVYLNQQNDKTTYFKIKLNSDNKITEIYEQTFCLP